MLATTATSPGSHMPRCRPEWRTHEVWWKTQATQCLPHPGEGQAPVPTGATPAHQTHRRDSSEGGWPQLHPSLVKASFPGKCQSVQVKTGGADKAVQPQGMGCHPGSCLPGRPCFQPSPAQPSREASLGTSRMATQGASGFLQRQMHSGSRLCL